MSTNFKLTVWHNRLNWVRLAWISSSSSWGDEKIKKFSLTLLLFELWKWQLGFFDKRCKKTAVRTLQWLLDFFDCVYHMSVWSSPFIGLFPPVSPFYLFLKKAEVWQEGFFQIIFTSRFSHEVYCAITLQHLECLHRSVADPGEVPGGPGTPPPPLIWIRHCRCQCWLNVLLSSQLKSIKNHLPLHHEHIHGVVASPARKVGTGYNCTPTHHVHLLLWTWLKI